MAYITPLKSQRALARELKHGRAPVVLLAGGYGAGKTQAGALSSAWLARENPGCDGMIIAPTWRLLWRVTVRAFLRMLPPGLVQRVHKSEGYIQLPDNRRVYLGAADKPESLEGSNLAWAWLDEARYYSREAWHIVLGRLRAPAARVCKAVLTSTPATHWMGDEFNMGESTPERPVIRARTKDNFHLHPDFVPHLERTYPPRLIEAVLEGKFVVLEGLVYEEFDRDVHLVDWPGDRSQPAVASWDPGYQRPAVLIWQRYPEPAPTPDSWVCVDELVPDNIATPQLVQRMRETGWRIETVIGDPAGVATHSSSGVSDFQVLRDAGYRVQAETASWARSIPNGINCVRGMLRAGDGSSRLYFSRSLLSRGSNRGVVRDIQRYVYPEQKDGRPVSDHPRKDGISDHTMDAMRYFAVHQNPLVQGYVKPHEPHDARAGGLW